MKEVSINAFIFALGVVAVLLVGLLTPDSMNTTLSVLLVFLGMLVGIANITANESRKFIIACTALLLISTLSTPAISNVPFAGRYLEAVLASLTAFVAPAAIVVSLKLMARLE